MGNSTAWILRKRRTNSRSSRGRGLAGGREAAGTAMSSAPLRHPLGTRPAPPHRPPAPAPRIRAPSPSMLSRPVSGRRVTRVHEYLRPGEYSRARHAAQQSAAGRARTTERRSAVPPHRHGGRERLLARRNGRAPVGLPSPSRSQPLLPRPCARCFQHNAEVYGASIRSQGCSP